MSTLQSIALAWSATNIVVFVWTVVGVFDKGSGTGWRLNILKVASIITFSVQLSTLATTPPPSTTHAIAGLALLACSTALFWNTVRNHGNKKLTLAFSEDTPETLFNNGSYRIVRHPFYTSYLLTYIAGWAFTVSWAMLAVVALMAAVYGSAARMEERKFRESSLSEMYAQYKANTGMFFPKLSKLFSSGRNQST